MLERIKRISTVVLAGTGLTLASPAMAEMGKAPVGPGGIYGGFTVGFFHADEPETEINAPGGAPQIQLDPDGGLLGGGHVGYVFMQQVLGLANFRVEGGLAFTSSDDDASFNLLNLIAQDGAVNVFIGGSSQTDQQTTRFDGSIALKGDVIERDGFSLPVGVEFFAVDVDQDITISGTGATFFSADIDANYYGVMGVLEPELQLTDQFSVVLRLAGGFYAYDFDGQFSGVVGATVNDSENGIGARAEAVGGLKMFLTEAFSLTLFGGVEYWSETPIANYPEALGTTAFVDRTELFAVKAGVMATVAFGGQ